MDFRTLVAFSAVAIVGLGAMGVASATQKQPKPSKVTFAEHVAPIIYKKCANCHRPGEVAPFSLNSYEEVKKRADMVALVTDSRQMPPWKTKPTDVAYANENRLTDAEIKTIQRWAQDGAPRGDAKKEPTPPPASNGWAMGKPDMIVQMPKPFKLGAEGTDEYWNFVIDPGLKEPVYVQGIDAKPGNKRVVHHIIAYLDDSGKSTKMAQGPKARDGGYQTSGAGIGLNPSGSFGGWAPGVSPDKLPDGVGYLLKPGTKIVLQVHYNKSGKEEVDQTKLGIYFLKNPVKTPARVAWLANPFINIAPGDKSATFSQTITLPADAVIYNVMPHMHKLGKSMKATAVLPNGTSKVLVDVPDWDFNWQIVYAFKEPFKAPKGTKIIVQAVYDNSTSNPFNPNNPPKRVTWGEKTSDEMMLLVAAVSFKGRWDYVD